MHGLIDPFQWTASWVRVTGAVWQRQVAFAQACARANWQGQLMLAGLAPLPRPKPVEAGKPANSTARAKPANVVPMAASAPSRRRRPPALPPAMPDPVARDQKRR